MGLIKRIMTPAISKHLLRDDIEDEVVVDGNHPLAGKTLWYAIKVLSVRPATEGEIEEAARAYDEARAEDIVEEAREAGLMPAVRKEPLLN